jgi:hypothetical protein
MNTVCTATQMTEACTNTTLSLKQRGSNTLSSTRPSVSTNSSKFASTTCRNDRTDYDFTNVSLMSMTNKKDEITSVDDTLAINDTTRPLMCTTFQTTKQVGFYIVK